MKYTLAFCTAALTLLTACGGATSPAYTPESVPVETDLPRLIPSHPK